MSDPQWRWCSTCCKWRLGQIFCVACGKPTAVGRISREEKPADPRVRAPVPNREVKKL